MSTSLQPPTEGLCVGKTDIFFLPPRRDKDSYSKEKEAKSICSQCPSQRQCLDYALHHEVYGIWGGMTERARQAMRREMGIKLNAIRPDNIVR